MTHLPEGIQDKSNEELLKMVYQFDQWNPEMLSGIEEELAKRGILPADLKIKREQLIAAEESKLITGRQAGLFGQVIGWLTVFGLLGIFIGYHYAFSKTSSRFTGKRYYTYNENSRKIGTYLFYTAICLSGAFLVYRLL